jgi:hypothetical protein
MIRIATLLAIVACLTIIGCQPPEGIAGVSKEDFDSLQMQVETLQADVSNLHAAIETLTDSYNEHIEKFHKGGTPAPAPPKATKPPQIGR